MAETRDLKIGTPANHPVSGLPLIACVPNRQYLPTVRIAYPCPYPNPYP